MDYYKRQSMLDKPLINAQDKCAIAHYAGIQAVSFSKRVNRHLSSTLALKLALSTILLACTSAAYSKSQAVPLSYDSWQTTGNEELNLPSLRGQGLSFDEQYQNKMLGEWS